MAVRSINFEVAAEEADKTDEDLIAATLVDKSGRSLGASMMVREPSQGSFAKLTVELRKVRGDVAAAPAIDDLLSRMIISPAEVVKMEEFKDRTDFVDSAWIWDLVADDMIDFDISSIVDFIRGVMQQFTGFPTKPSSGSTGGQPTTGKSSTGGSRRAASTRSRSTPAVSGT